MNCTESPHSHLEASKDDQQHEAGDDVVDEVPGEGGQPEGKGPHPTDNLQVLGAGLPLTDEEVAERGGKEGHAEEHAEADGESQRQSCRHGVFGSR